VVGLGAGGVSGAAVVGYDWRQERALVGVEGEVSANAAKASLTGPFGVSASASAPLEAAGRVRFGALLTASTTLYGEIGGAWTHAQASAATPGFSLSAGKDYVGAQFGLGVETMLTPHIGARVEYIETRYAKQDGFTPTTAKTQSGLIYKF